MVMVVVVNYLLSVTTYGEEGMAKTTESCNWGPVLPLSNTCIDEYTLHSTR